MAGPIQRAMSEAVSTAAAISSVGKKLNEATKSSSKNHARYRRELSYISFCINMQV